MKLNVKTLPHQKLNIDKICDLWYNNLWKRYQKVPVAAILFDLL